MKITFIIQLLIILTIAMIPFARAHAETFLTIDQAKQVIWQNVSLIPANIELTKEQMKAIHKASKTRVRSSKIRAWKTPDNGWLIIDQVIGKHENIDIAVGLTSKGKVKDVEVLTYRETYGSQVRNKKWLAQFFGRGAEKVLKLDKDIKNISGATLSCRHITDGINRLTHTWDIVLKHRI